MNYQPGPQRKWQGSRGLQASWIALAVFGVLVGNIAHAQDGRALMQKVVKSYQNLDSYDGTATVDIKIIGKQGAYKNKALRTQSLYAILKFKKPNKLMLQMSAPSGTRKVYSDGKDFYVYDESNNQYTRDPAPRNTKEMGLVLLRRAGIIAALDPLYFLTEAALPKELQNLKVVGTQKVNGRATVKVTGVTRTSRMERKLSDGRKVVLPATNRKWTWWIDRQDNLIRRVEARDENIQVGVPKRQGEKVIAERVAAYSLSRHNVATVKPNGVSDEAAFRFDPPKNAALKKSLQELLQGGK